MTVAAIVPRNDYVGTGLVDTYAYGFKIVNQDDLLVIKADTDGVEEVLTLGVDYTVTGVGLINGGTVVLSSDLENNYTLTILQNVPIEQETSIRNDSEYYASIHEDTFDTGRRIDQQIAESLGRAILFKRSSTATGIYIGDIVPDSVLLSNPAGDGLDWADSSDFAGTTNHFLLENIGVNTHYQIDDHINNTSNPHSVTKTQVGLGNADNTSDLNKPISTATQTALDGKVDENAAITGATKTKITYDAKGLVTSGADATTADIADSSNKRYVTDAQLTVIGNTSGTNTGDQDLSGYVPYVGATANLNLGTFKLKMPSGSIIDSTNNDSIHPNDRRLIDSGGVYSVEWEAKRLNTSSGTIFDWNTGELYDTTAALSIHIGNRQLLDATATVATIDWENCVLRSPNGNLAVEFSSSYHQLFDIFGLYPSVDFGNYQLLNVNIVSGTPLLSWGPGDGGSVRIYQGYTNGLIGDFSSLQLNDTFGITTLDWGARVLVDDYTVASVDWNLYFLATVDGTALHWGNRQAFDVSGAQSIDWNSRILSTDFNGDSVNWQDRVLIGPSSNNVLYWSHVSGRVGILNGSPAAALDVDGTVKLGVGGAVFQKILSSTSSLDFPSIAANSVAVLTMNVTGATVGASVHLGPPSTLEANLTFCGFVSAAGVVSVRLHNGSGGAINPAAATWRATVINF